MRTPLKELLAEPVWQLLSQSPDLGLEFSLLWGGGRERLDDKRNSSPPWQRKKPEPGCGVESPGMIIF